MVRWADRAVRRSRSHDTLGGGRSCRLRCRGGDRRGAVRVPARRPVRHVNPETCSRRRYGSLSTALDGGRSDREVLRALQVAHRHAGWSPVCAVEPCTSDGSDVDVEDRHVLDVRTAGSFVDRLIVVRVSIEIPQSGVLVLRAGVRWVVAGGESTGLDLPPGRVSPEAHGRRSSMESSRRESGPTGLQVRIRGALDRTRWTPRLPRWDSSNRPSHRPEATRSASRPVRLPGRSGRCRRASKQEGARPR